MQLECFIKKKIKIILAHYPRSHEALLMSKMMQQIIAYIYKLRLEDLKTPTNDPSSLRLTCLASTRASLMDECQRDIQYCATRNFMSHVASSGERFPLIT